MGEKRDLEVESVSLGKFSELFTIEIRNDESLYFQRPEFEDKNLLLRGKFNQS